MLKVENKFIFIGLVGLALGLLIVYPITALHLFTNLNWLRIVLMYATLILPALIGLLLLVNVWGTFEMKKGASEH